MRTPHRPSDGLAVFSRNHRKYLDAAARLPAGKRVAFRAEKKWVSAARALRISDSLPVYFAVVGGPARVEYTALLSEVLLEPRKGAARTQAALRHSLPMSRDEGLWETARTKGRVRTLYVITGCKRLKQPFPISRLVKVGDGLPLSSDYRYSYSIVRPVEAG